MSGIGLTVDLCQSILSYPMKLLSINKYTQPSSSSSIDLIFKILVNVIPPGTGLLIPSWLMLRHLRERDLHSMSARMDKREKLFLVGKLVRFGSSLNSRSMCHNAVKRSFDVVNLTSSSNIFSGIDQVSDPRRAKKAWWTCFADVIQWFWRFQAV